MNEQNSTLSLKYYNQFFCFKISPPLALGGLDNETFTLCQTNYFSDVADCAKEFYSSCCSLYSCYWFTFSSINIVYEGHSKKLSSEFFPGYITYVFIL